MSKPPSPQGNLPQGYYVGYYLNQLAIVLFQCDCDTDEMELTVSPRVLALFDPANLQRSVVHSDWDYTTDRGKIRIREANL